MDDRRRPALYCRRPWAALLLLCLLAGALPGCENLGIAKKFKNPVCPPPPTRVANLVDDSDSEYAQNERGEDEAAEDQGVAFVSATEDGRKTIPLPNGDVAATVNGSPIFMDDVLQPFAVGLAREAQHRSPAEMRQIRVELTQKHLRHHIEREVLVQALKVKLKDDHVKGLNDHLDKDWANEELDMMKKAKVNTRAELDASLRKSGTSLTQMKATFKNQKMAQQYLSIKAVNREKPSRSELLAYYNEHLADYETPAKVKWRQIVLAEAEHGGTKRSEQFAAGLVRDLRAGKREFAATAKKYSAGPTAQQGGDWDWTAAGSVSWETIDEALFKLEPGDISDPIQTTAGWQIVEVIERTEAGRVPFDEVHDDIANQLQQVRFKEGVNSLIDKLVSSAEIEYLLEERPNDETEAAPARETESKVVPAGRQTRAPIREL